MKTKRALLYTSSLSGLFLILIDQLLKFFARSNPTTVYYLCKPWIGWEFFLNDGIAFGIPFPYPLLIIATPLLLIWFIIQIKKQKTTPLFNIGIILIVTGAVSNLIDRVLFNNTIDYFRFFTSIFNLADISIVAGAVCCLIVNQQASKNK